MQGANLVARKLGFHPEPDPELPLVQEPAIDALGLGDVVLATMMVDLEDELESKHKPLAVG